MAQSGAEHVSNGNPTLRRCHIHDGENAGIWVNIHGQGVIEDCEIAANADAGVLLADSSNPILLRRWSRISTERLS